MTTFYEYLKADKDRNVYDHALRVAEAHEDGTLRFYIHPSLVNGNTPWFDLKPTGEIVTAYENNPDDDDSDEDEEPEEFTPF